MKVFLVMLLVPCAMAVLEPYLHPCHSTDSACMKSSAQTLLPVVARGVPALSVRPLDPLLLPRVAARQAGLDMLFTDSEVKGLRNCKVLGLKRVGDKIHLDIKCSVQLSGDYRLSGTLLVFQVSGNDKYTIRIRDIVLKIILKMSSHKKGGQDHWSLDSWSQTHEVQGRARYIFHNLFEGKNPGLAKAVHQVANDSWRVIVRDVGPPIVDAVVAATVHEIRKIFDQVPSSQLSLD